MLAVYTVIDPRGNIVEQCQTAFVRTADFVSRALRTFHPDCDIEVEFKAI